MEKAVAYARFSSDNQREESIDAQLRAIDEYIARNDILLIDKYIDQAKSATTDDRPAFQQMIKDSNEQLFDYVIVHKLDRFARNRYDSAIYKKKLKENGVDVLSVLENIDNSPESIILESVLEGMSEYYSKNLSREVKKGQKENALKCKFNGGTPPLGYDINENKEFIINEFEAIAVRIIYEMYLQGHGYSAIIKELNNQGFLTKRGKPFGKNSIYEILGNEKYTGTYVYNKHPWKINGKQNRRVQNKEKDIIRVKNGMPAIIDERSWNRVQQIRQANKRRGSNSAKQLYLLTGLIYCGECGSRMSGLRRHHYRKNEGKVNTRYYICSEKKHKSTNCSLRSINAEKLERNIINMFSETLYTENNISILIESMKQHLNRNSDIDTSYLKNELSSIDIELNNLINAISSGINSETMIDRINTLETRKNALKTQINSEELKFNARYSDEELKSFLMKHKRFEDFSAQDKKKILELFINKIIVYPDNVEIHLNLVDLDGFMIPLSGRDKPHKDKEYIFNIYIKEVTVTVFV